VNLNAGTFRGQLIAGTRGGGLALRSRTPLAIENLSLALPDDTVWRDLDLRSGISADHTPQGCQAEIAGLTAETATTPLLLLDVKAGRLRGDNQPLKATGKISANLAAFLPLTSAGSSVRLNSGEASVEFVASFQEKTEVHAQVALRELATDIDG